MDQMAAFINVILDKQLKEVRNLTARKIMSKPRYDFAKVRREVLLPNDTSHFPLM